MSTKAISAKRILYIGSGAPWIGGAGYLVRQRMFLRALGETASLHLALFDLPDALPPPPPPPLSFPCMITPLRFPRHAGRGKIRGALADLTNTLPRMVRDVDLAPIRRQVPATAGFDAIFAFRIDFAHYAGVLDHPRLLLDVDDPEHIRWRRRAEASGVPMDWRSERDLRKLRRFELKAVSGAAHAFVCQEADRGLFPSQNVKVVPNGVEVSVTPPPRVATPPTILFLGNFAAGAGSPNHSALEWFIGSVWPLIHSECPSAECHIAGRMDDAIKQRLLAVPKVRVMGFVESLAAAFSGARLSVAPLRFGTGTRIKILDSFAHACPVVSTSAGADGLEVTADRNILIGDDAETFAAHCAALLQNESLARVLGAGGYALVAEKYNAAAIESSLRQFFETVLD